MEDMRRQLKKYFSSRREVPQKIEEVVKLGEKEINKRIKILRMADKGGWGAIEKFIADPLCDNAEEDKRWKQAMREAKEEQAKRKSGGYEYLSRSRGRDNYRSGGSYRSYRRDSRDRRDWLPDRYVKGAGNDVERVCLGEIQGPVTVVERQGTSKETVGSPLPRKMGSSREEIVTDSITKVSDMDVPRVCNKSLEDKKGFDSAEEGLDELEERIVERESEVCVMHKEGEKIERKIHDTLRKHVCFWQESGQQILRSWL